MNMHETQGWLLDANAVRIALSVWAAAVVLHAWWRSRGPASPDPIRESGPIA
jgi:hypothetical protein